MKILKSQKVLQTRVADAAAPYGRAQGVSDSAGTEKNEPKGQVYTERKDLTKHNGKQISAKDNQILEGSKSNSQNQIDQRGSGRMRIIITVKQLENELEFWKKAAANENSKREELRSISTQVRAWCNAKIKLKEDYHKLMGGAKHDRQREVKKKK